MFLCLCIHAHIHLTRTYYPPTHTTLHPHTLEMSQPTADSGRPPCSAPGEVLGPADLHVA